MGQRFRSGAAALAVTFAITSIAACGLSITGEASDSPTDSDGGSASLPREGGGGSSGDGDGDGDSSSSSSSSPNADSDPPETSAAVEAGGVCVSDQGLQFDGKDDFAAVPHDAALDLTTGAFTVEAWIKPANKAEAQIASHHNHDNSNGWVLLLKDMRVEMRMYGRSSLNASEKVQITAGNFGSAYVVQDAWAHVAASFDGATLAVFYDGQRRDSQLVINFARSTEMTPLTIGRASYTTTSDFWFKGIIDEVHISKSARYATSLTTIAKPTTPFVVDAATIALYRFDETGLGIDNARIGSPSLGGTLGAGGTAPKRVAIPCPKDR